MTPMAGGGWLWRASVSRPGARIAIRAADAKGRTGDDAIEPAGPAWSPPVRIADGGDRDRIGAWPEQVIFDTQSGQKRKGRHW